MVIKNDFYQHYHLLKDGSIDTTELLFQSTSDLMLYLDTHGRIIKINQAGIDLSGFSEDEIIGRHFWKIPGVFSKRNVVKYLSVFRNSIKGVPTKEFISDLYEKSGKKHIMVFSTYPILEEEKVVSILVVGKDFTVEKDLQDKYSLIANKTSDFISMTTFSYPPIFTYISPSNTSILGYEPEDVIGKSGFDLIHPDDVKTLRSLLTKYLSMKAKQLITGRDQEIVEKIKFRLIDKQGTWHDLESTVNIVGNEILFVSRDVTERIRTEKELQKKSFIIGSTTDAVVTTDTNGMILTCNQAGEKLYGYEISEFIGNNISIVYLPEEVSTLNQIISDLSQKRTIPYIEINIKRKDGTIIPVTLSLTPLCDDDGRVTEFLGIARDISGQKEVEKTLKRSEALLKEAQSIAHIGHWNFRLSTGELWWSDELYRIYGIDRQKENVSLDHGIGMIHPDDKKRSESVFQQALKDGKKYTLDYRIIRRDGEIRYLRGIGKPEKDENGEIIGIYGTGQDITSEKIAEEHLKRTSEHLQNIIQSSPSAIISVDQEGMITSWNPASMEIFGWTSEETIGMFNPTIPSDMKSSYLDIIKEKQMNLEIRMLRKDGAFIHVSLSSTPLFDEHGGFTGALGVMSDISEHKQIEDRFRLISEVTTDLIYEWDVQHDTLRWFGDIDQALGYRPGEIPHTLDAWIQLIHPDDLNTLSDSVVRHRTEPHPIFEVYRIKRKDGSWVYWEDRGNPILDEKGMPMKWIGGCKDITNQKQFEQDLRDSEEKYRDIFELTPDGIVTIGSDGMVKSINPGFTKLTGYESSDIVGIHFTKVPTLLKREIPTYVKLFYKMLKGETAITFDFKWKRVDGKIRDGEARFTRLIKNEKNEGILLYLRDTTESKRAERALKELNQELERKVNERTEQIIQLLKQKDEFIHQLGHDLKNPLGPLVNLLPILEKKAVDENDKEIFKVLLRNVKYMKNLVTKTLELARLNSPNTKVSYESISLKQQFDEIIGKNTYLFDEKHITVHTDISKEIKIEADRLLLEELFTNLLNNAVKYSHQQGTITIHVDQDDLQTQISIHDDGIGMSKNQLNRLFDEFYKADQSRHDFDSSGLGMPICKRIVEKHQGRIWAESKGIGKGSSLFVSIPKRP